MIVQAYPPASEAYRSRYGACVCFRVRVGGDVVRVVHAVDLSPSPREASSSVVCGDCDGTCASRVIVVNAASCDSLVAPLRGGEQAGCMDLLLMLGMAVLVQLLPKGGAWPLATEMDIGPGVDSNYWLVEVLQAALWAGRSSLATVEVVLARMSVGTKLVYIDLKRQMLLDYVVGLLPLVAHRPLIRSGPCLWS